MSSLPLPTRPGRSCSSRGRIVPARSSQTYFGFEPATPHRPIEATETWRVEDPQRGKQIPVRVTYPAAQGNGPFPVVVFSHGVSASKDDYPSLARAWAQHGYIVMQPTHEDSKSLLADPSRYNLRRQLIRAGRDPKLWESRITDISRMLDALPQLQREHPQLNGRIAADRIGIGGHSLGADIAQLMGGAILHPKGQPDTCYRDERIGAVLMLSGIGRDWMNPTRRTWSQMTVPMMTMTGSADVVARLRGPRWRMEPFRFSPPGNKYHVWIDGASHVSFANEFEHNLDLPTDAETDVPHRQSIWAYVQTASMAFWDAHLKDEQPARDYLRSRALQTYGMNRVELYHR